MKPMLAHKYIDKRKHLTWPCHVQPKLNGVRLLARNEVFQSRDGHKWHQSMLEPIRNALLDVLDTWVLDGELYHHGWSLQEINAAGSVNRVSPSRKTERLQYHIFDALFLPDLGLSFVERWSALCADLFQIVDSHLCLSLVTTHTAFSEIEADQYYKQFKDLGYEGMMYRDSAAPYGTPYNCTNQENRWNCLLKRKDWLDDDFTIVDVVVGEGKYSDAVGALVLQMPCGLRFQAGTGMSDMQRHEYFDRPPIGRLARIRYEMLSDGGIPLKPVVEAIL